MFEWIILKCDIHASMLCLSGLFFLKPIRHIVWNEEDWVAAHGAQMDAHYPETRCHADGMKSVCFSWNTLLWLSSDSWKHACIISVILISCCHGDERRRHDSLWSGRKWPPGGAETRVSLISHLPLGVCCHSPSFQPRQIAARVPAGPLLSGDVSIARPERLHLVLYLFIYF